MRPLKEEITKDSSYELQIDDYIAAVQPLIDDGWKKYDRELAQEFFEQKITDSFPEQMARPYKECTPSDLLRQRHQKLFAQFREAMIADKLSFLPAAAATVFTYLLAACGSAPIPA